MCRTHHVNELREFELDTDAKNVGSVDYGADKFVVVGEEIVVEALGIGVTSDGAVHDERTQQPHAERFRDAGHRDHHTTQST